MAEDRAAAIQELTLDLAQRHTELGQLLKERANSDRKILNARSGIHGVRKKLDLLTGKRRGGRPTGTSAVSLSGRLHQTMLDDYDREWCLQDLAQLHGESRKKIQGALQSLAEYKQIVRIRRGVYRSVKLGEIQEPVIHRERTSVLCERVARAVNDAPDQIWGAKRLVEAKLASTVGQAREVLKQLAADGSLRRVRRGVYVHPDNHAVKARYHNPNRAQRSQIKHGALRMKCDI